MSVADAIREWQAEVDREMERLIKIGVPPYKAADQARNIVSRRRRVLLTEKELNGR